jgi:tRNA pseudouridine55 synthase
MSRCLDFLPAIVANSETAGKVKHGQPLFVTEFPMPDTLLIAGDKNDAQNSMLDIRVLDSDDNLLAIVTPDKYGKTYKYCCVFNA